MTQAELDRILETLTGQLGAGWVEIVQWLYEGNQIADIAAALRYGQIDAVIMGLQQAALRFADVVDGGYVYSARQAAKWLDDKVSNKLISYDGTNTRAVRWAAENRYDLRGSITTEQMDAIRGAITNGVREGINPLDVARDVRESIGLTDYQADIVRNYRRKLEQGRYADALAARLSSGHSDRAIRNALDNNRTLTSEQIDTAVTRYRENWITYRAETIARTEGLRAMHDGTEELYQQAIEQRQIDRNQLRSSWMPGPDTTDARPHHRDDFLLDQHPMIGEDFVLSNGTRMKHPGDPRGGAEENANCRCTRVVTFAS